VVEGSNLLFCGYSCWPERPEHISCRISSFRSFSGDSVPPPRLRLLVRKNPTAFVLVRRTSNRWHRKHSDPIGSTRIPSEAPEYHRKHPSLFRTRVRKTRFAPWYKRALLYHAAPVKVKVLYRRLLYNLSKNRTAFVLVRIFHSDFVCNASLKSPKASFKLTVSETIRLPFGLCRLLIAELY